MTDFAPQHWDGDEARARSFEELLESETRREKARRAARTRVDAEERGAVEVPAFTSLAARLARPLQPVEFRIEGWWPIGARVLEAAQFKAGKTTLTGNVIRTLVDGDPFLDRFRARAVSGSVALLDFEMSERQLDAWLEAQSIRRAHDVFPVPLRGMAAGFDILRPEVRALWATRLREHDTEVVILDPVRPILDSIGLDEHRDAGRFLVALDALLHEAGVSEALVIHHMGHNGERSRGDSRLRDWPDVEWRLVRETDDPASARFLTAFGRDVEQPEQRLDYNRLTRRLTVAGGSRRDAKQETALDAVLDVLGTQTGPMTGRAIKAALLESEHSRDTIDAALSLGVRTLTLKVEAGPRSSKLYSAVSGVRPLIGAPDTRTLSGAPSGVRTPDAAGHSGHSTQEAAYGGRF